jgi:hypothetical protein
MTPEQKRAQVRAAIIKAVPEVMEWRCEGCKRKHSEYVNGCVYCWSNLLTDEINRVVFPHRAVRLVERPIRLADVLHAVKEHDPHFYFKRENKSNDGETLVSGTEKLCDAWNFLRDDLSQQSEECVQFLFDLLCR